MLNECIFLLHIISVSILSLVALRLGQSALVAMICLQCLTANLFVTKQITLFGLNVTGTDVFIVGIGLCLSFLQEFYGNRAAKKALGLSFFIVSSFMLFGFFQCGYAPSQFDLAHSSFCTILNFTPRITIASIFAYLISQSCAIAIFALLKRVFKDRFFILRTGLTNCIGQLIDTVIFSFTALYGIVHSVPQIIILSLTIKIIAIALTTPFIAFAKKLFKPGTHNNEN